MITNGYCLLVALFLATAADAQKEGDFVSLSDAVTGDARTREKVHEEMATLGSRVDQMEEKLEARVGEMMDKVEGAIEKSMSTMMKRLEGDISSAQMGGSDSGGSAIPKAQASDSAAPGKRSSCPNWPVSDEEYTSLTDDQRSKLDSRLRYIYESQHPKDCSTAKFLVYRHPSDVGLGAQFAPSGVALQLAVAHNRVLIRKYSRAPGAELKGWPMGGCPLGTPECYWLPTGGCTLTEEEVAGDKPTTATRYDWDKPEQWDNIKDERIIHMHPDFWGLDEYIDYESVKTWMGLIPHNQVSTDLRTSTYLVYRALCIVQSIVQSAWCMAHSVQVHSAYGTYR
jgi:hypothetical protein